MTRPFPLPGDINSGVKHTRPAVHVVRAACAHLRSFTSGLTPSNAAERMFGRDLGTDVILKGATAPATTTGANWASALAGVAIYDTIQSITSLSAAAEVISRGLKITMDGIAEHRVPGRVLNAAAAGQWVAENAPAPARQLSFSNAAILRPRKLSVIMAYTREQAESSNIENIVRATLGEATGLALDAKMFSSDVAGAAPAGLFNGVAPLTPASGGGATPGEAAATDIGALFGALAANGGGKTAVIVAAMPQAVRLKLIAGPKFDFDILASTSLPSGVVGVIELASFCSGFSNLPEFKVGRDATIHMEDTAPSDPIMAGVPVRSMYQLDSIALKMDLWAAYGLRATGHAQWISATTW
jgi:Phage capsid family